MVMDAAILEQERKLSLGTVQLFTHGFKVIPKDPRIAVTCRRVLNEWCTFTQKKVENSRGQLVLEKELEHMYGAYIREEGSFWFHKGQMRGLDLELRNFSLSLGDLNIELMESYTPSTIKYSLLPGRVLRDYQDEAKAFALEPVPITDFFSKLIAMPVGSGKSQVNDMPVQTPTGWTPIGDLKVGDEIIAADGTTTTVTGVFPQGSIPAYRLVFSDDRFVDASGDHLWRAIGKGFDGKELGVITTLEMIELAKKKKNKVRIPLCIPPQIPDIDLEIDPYLLGNDPRITFIPEPYMRGSVGQRLALIQGLLDRSGTIDRNGGISFGSSSGGLVIQLQTLIRSIGGVANREYKPSDKKKAWRVFIRYKAPRHLFRLPENRDRLPEVKISPLSGLRLESAIPLGNKECTCISIAHPERLYVTKDYIVTHNTVTLCGTAADNAQRLVVGVLPKYAEKWGSDIVSNLALSPKEVMLIRETSQLRGVIDMCMTQGTKKLPPVLIITLTTMRAFIEKYEEDPAGCREDMGCVPTELWKILDCGIFAIDEAHEHLHTVFKTTMYLHGPKFIALSGTMRTEDEFQEKVQNTIFPKIKRFLKVKMEKYIDVEFIGYSFNRELLPKIRYQVFGRKDYSHTTLEGSIAKRPEVLRDYIQMVDDLLVHSYIHKRSPGEKAGIYVATVDMADKFVTYLMLRHPSLNIIRYCAGEGDKYEDLMKCDIYVSTIQSAGTALDIPQLTDVVCTTMVNSSKSNIQVLGRLRKLPNDRKVTMYMPYCRQIQKHVKYTQFRQDIFKEITKSIKTFFYDTILGGISNFFGGRR